MRIVDGEFESGVQGLQYQILTCNSDRSVTVCDTISYHIFVK